MNEYNNYQPNPAATLWRTAAKAMMAFIKTHVRVIGFDEIEAFDKVKKLYEEAEANDRRYDHSPYRRPKQFTPPWLDRDWRMLAPEWPTSEA